MDKSAEIVKYGRLIAREKLVIWSGGNISVRHKKGFIIKKQGADMSKASAGDYIKVPLCERQALKSPFLSSETLTHLACYQAREDAGAVIHAHSPYMTAAAERTKTLKDISYEFERVVGSGAPVVNFFQPGSEALAKAVSHKIRAGANAVILRKHGGIVIGRSLEQAFYRILALERACVTFLHI